MRRVSRFLPAVSVLSRCCTTTADDDGFDFTDCGEAEGVPVVASPATARVVHKVSTTSAETSDEQRTPEELAASCVSYLNTCRARHLITEEEERRLFPVLQFQSANCPLPALLDVLEPMWATATAERHGAEYRRAVRDRVFADATAGALDGVLTARCIVVLAMRGHCRRDLEVFRALGQQLLRRITDVEDPHTLCYILVAFQAARIKPPESFLAVIARRLPVLHKKHPIMPVPAFRAFMFLHRSDYPLMNPYRFLADRVMGHIKQQLKREGAGADFVESRKTQRDLDDEIDDDDLDILRALKEDRPVPEASVPSPAPAAPSSEESLPEGESAATLQRVMPHYAVDEAPDAATTTGEVSLPGDEKVRMMHRFYSVTHLKPAQLTKLLLVLAAKQAPRQQYLRPLVADLLVPSVPHFNPPSFTRMLRALRSFGSEETVLIEAIVDTVVKRGPHDAALGDVLELLRLLSRPSTPPEINMERFFTLCRDVFRDDSKLRPRDMIAITGDLLQLRRKLDDEATPAFTLLCEVVERFAARMAFLLDLGLLNPTHAEVLLEQCRDLQPPDPHGRLVELKAARQRVSDDGEDAYFSLIDIDVRDIVMRVQTVNSVAALRSFRPLPAQVITEFKALLAYMRADYILDAVHLFEQAYPGALSVPMRRVISNFVLMKLQLEYDVLSGARPAPPPPLPPRLVPNAVLEGSDETHRRVFEPFDVHDPRYSPVLLDQDGLCRLANVVAASPLLRVKKSAVVWTLLRKKAEALKCTEVVDRARSMLEGFEAAELEVMASALRGD